MDISKNCPLIAKTDTDHSFTYQAVTFDQNTLHIFAGLNAVDNRQNVALTFAALQRYGLQCARMGAYKPRTSPYSFQGLGAECLPYVFELAGKYGIRIIAMEVTHDAQIAAIYDALQQAGNPTGVMLQIGTRNAQNFELLKAVGTQVEFPILYKRGFGITLEESLSACEYLAHAGNHKIVFCLRGMKSQFAAPHRNFIDFSLVSRLKSLTKLAVCVDPSHAVGNYARDADGIPDVFHAAAQGIIAGANMLLVDIHPQPCAALVDSQQAIGLQDFEWFLNDINIARNAYTQRSRLAKQNTLVAAPLRNDLEHV